MFSLMNCYLFFDAEKAEILKKAPIRLNEVNPNSARSVRLDGKVREELKVSDNTVFTKAGKGKIYTIEID